MAKNIFNSIQLLKPKSNAFDLTHDVKLSMDMGKLVPIMTMECIPGDKVKLSGDALIRFSPLVAPVMHRMDVSIHYFFVPNRILWENWEKWIIQQKRPDGFQYQHPFVTVNRFGNDYTQLMDYMGVPDPTLNPHPSLTDETINPMPFAAYQKIYNDYYRDQNLVAEVPFLLTDGTNQTNITQLTTLRKRAWEHDYFTSSLPFAQKGDAVLIPAKFDDVQVLRNQTGGAASNTLQAVAGSTNQVITNQGTTGANITANELYADTSDLKMNTDINELRRALRLQEWLERNARGGTRYIESILSHFGVKSSDKRLQRAEYITGVKSPVVISEVLNTSGAFDPTDPTLPASQPQGNMAGHGVSVATGKFGQYFCEEHGYIIGIMSVMPKTAYQQGIPKHFLKINDPFEYFWPSFAHIGEQQVFKKEVYAFNANGNDTFGYVPRYAEYRFIPNTVSGQFRDILDYWHLGRIFNQIPSLNQDFVECTPTNRVFAITDDQEQKLFVQVINKVLAIRPIPKFGTPML